MKQLFVLKSKPFSINAAFYRDGKILTAECREWQQQVFHQLWSESNLAKFAQLREYFDESKHSVKVSIKVVYPRDTFVTKQHTLSARTMDCSNFEKLLVDLFFDARYFAEDHPRGVPNFNTNDKHIVSLYSQKTFHESPDHLIYFTIKIVNREF